MKKNLKRLFPISIKDTFVFLITMGVASAICELLRKITTSDVHVPLIFVLAVLVVSFLANGYFFGLLAAVTSVFAVNWAFTFPYRKLDFSVYGYPLTFITMLAVGIAASTLATRLKEQEKLKLENEKEKMRANLLRSVSHDLRTPLTSIGGNISAVLDSGNELSEEQKRSLLINAKEDADWLFTMVENLLSITKINTEDESRLKKSEELIEDIFAETASKFKSHYEDITVTVECPDEVLFVEVDPMLIEQVLFNLMENSVKHGKSTENIYLSAVRNKDFVEITVKDDGEGIDKDMLSELFSLSERSGLFSNDNNRFMGIGLMVCKTIIDAHGGRIYAKNNEDGGAQFTFTVPSGGIVDESD